MQQTANIVRLGARRSSTSKRRFFDGLLSGVLGGLLVAVLAVGAFALWRGTTENTSQPHVPTWKQVTPR